MLSDHCKVAIVGRKSQRRDINNLVLLELTLILNAFELIKFMIPNIYIFCGGVIVRETPI